MKYLNLLKIFFSNVNEEFLKELEINTPDIWDHYQQTRIESINNYYRKLFVNGVDEGIIREDININVVLTVFMNLMELPLKTQYKEFLGLHNQNIYELTTDIFFKGITIT